MTSKQTKRIAFLLAASLLMNTVALPVSAESDVVIVGEMPTEASTEAPVEVVTEAPTEEVTEAPTQEVTEATTEAPTEAPTEEVTEAPTEEATEAPTEEATEEPTVPLTRDDILAAQKEGYAQALAHFRSMDISSDDRSMSLEWWCVMTGNVSMQEPDYSILDAAEGTEAPQEETAEKAWEDYIIFSEVISVRSASDLILLSYVSPSLYQNRTVTLFADAGNEFDLVHPLTLTDGRTLRYRGLGDLGSPFSGTIRYAENSENITFVLDAPLFIGLSTKAKFLNRFDQPNTVYLISKAGYAFDGLLARHVLGEQQNEANWFVQLNAPDFSSGAVYVLPSLLGILYGNANVSLLLKDNSFLSPSPRGYLCATMHAQSSLCAAGITRDLSAPLVGEVSPDATLVTDAPQAEEMDPTGEEIIAPTEETTDPTGEVTEPTKETTVPTEEVTEPTGEVTTPIAESTLLAKQEEGYQQAVKYYRSLPVSRSMPLEWWYVMTEQVTMRQPDDSVLGTGEDAATDEPEAAEPVTTEPEVAAPEAAAPEIAVFETVEPTAAELEETEKDWSAYLVYPENITVSSATDLILLSYVAPDRYQASEIVFKGDQPLDLTQTVVQEGNSFSYQGLGSLDAPYSGTFRFDEDGVFVLSAPLFVGLSTKAKFQNQTEGTATITLVSKATLSVTSLLAVDVVGDAGSTADWAVCLNDPENGTSDPYVLPSLFGTIRKSANVKLTLWDASTLSPSARGYLCAIMEGGASLDAGNITRMVYVPLVGVLPEGATLTASRASKTDDSAPIFYVDMSDEDFKELADYYAGLEVVPGEMPLEWWFAACGKLDDLRAYLTAKAEQQAAAYPATLPLFPDKPAEIGEPDAAENGQTPVVVFPAPAETETDASAEPSAQDGIAMFAAENTADAPILFSEESAAGSDSAEGDDAADDGSGTTAAKKPNLNIASTEDLNNLSKAKASDYQNETITITASGSAINVCNGDTPTFFGLGTVDAPFAGKIQYSNASEKASIVLNRALFNALSADAYIANVNLTWAGTVAQADDAAILADTVYAGASGTQDWKVTLGSYSADSQKVYCLPALIGTIDKGATVTLSAENGSAFAFGGKGFFCDTLNGTLNATYPSNPPAFKNEYFSNTQNTVGSIVGTMGNGAELTVNGENIVIDVSTSGSTAGGLVGSMANGATLTVNANSITVKQVTAATTDGSNVGALVGEAANPKITIKSGVTAAEGDSHQGLTGCNVGGLVGKLTLTDENAVVPVTSVTNFKLTGVNCGGLFGELDSQTRLTISAPAAEGAASSTLQASITVDNASDADKSGNVGGLIGLYKPTAGDTTLSVSDVSTTVNAGDKAFDNLGGFIGAVEASGDKTYVELSSCTANLSAGAANANWGGFVGKLSAAPVHLKVSGAVTFGTDQNNDCTGGLVGLAEDNGHLIEVDGFTLTTTSNLSGGNSGGLVGDMQSGAVYMNEVPKLNIDKFEYGQTHGWIMGKRGNVLVCAAPAIKNWPVGANVTAANDNNNDTGVWGQVLQLYKFDHEENNALVTLDSANHTVTIKEPTGSNGSYTAGNPTEFAALALRVQLNDGGMLKIPGDSDLDNVQTITLTLSDDIVLTNTGLTGLTPDCSTDKYSYKEHGFVINGAGKTITLPDVTVFASPAGHNYQGLIAQCSTSLVLDSLTVAGGSTIQCHDSTAVYSGIVAELKCPATISKTTSTITWTVTGNASIQDSSGTFPSNVSGFIGMVNTTAAITFDESTWNGTLTDNSDGGAVCIMGGFVGDSYNKATDITIENSTVSGTVETGIKTADAMVGGLFGRLLRCKTLKVTDLTVTAEVNTQSSKYSGGLLGFELYCTDTATFNGVTIGTDDKEAKLNTNGARFGGLICKGAGYWQVTGKGIHFQSATITGKTDNETPSGLLVCIGCSDLESYEGLYLEVGLSENGSKSAYTIDDGVTVELTNDGYFDELVGRSIYGADSGKNGIVSIATINHAEIDIDSNCNTYINKLGTWNNPCTRYYYNLDKFREGTLPGATISTAEQMVLWSAYNESKNCKNTSICVKFADKATSRTIKGENGKEVVIDLTGYSFYPVAYDGTSIQDANITFDFQQLEETEASANNKQPSDTKRQHAGMHTGIFTSVEQYNSEMNVDGLTLQGTVGGLDNKFGALVRGEIVGRKNVLPDEKNVKDTQINIKNVKLDGIRIHSALASTTVAPLLIHSIGNYVTLRLNGVTTTEKYNSTVKIASSLIGRVGSSSSSISIDLEFSQIRLTPPNAGERPDAKMREKCTLFTHALFLESFQYATGCRGVYNFKCDDSYTIGREVSNTASGRNPEKQYWFFNEWDTENYTGLVCQADGTLEERKEKAAKAYTEFFPYVYHQEENGADNYKELDVNLQPFDLTDGCGTYSDPYRITKTNSGALQELAKALSNGGSNPSWKVNINTAVLPGKSATPNFSSDDGHIHGEAAVDQELVLVCGEKGNGWSIANAGNTTVRANEDKMLEYLRNAYYMITEDITLPSDWTGLGTDTAPFRGVIVGGGESTPTVTVTSTSTKQFGGLIKFSQGSVVKNLKISYSNSFALASGGNSIFNYDSAVFFGGVVGCCMAGDTVIDGVSVTLSNVTVTGENKNYAAIGGYVGLVGGANNQGGGGVVLRNVPEDNSNLPATDGYYTNPYVGRVLDGYAVTDGNAFINGDKEGNGNYIIPPISDPILTIDKSTVTVGNGEGLWLLSAMENSRHGDAYSSGKPRTQDYSTVGQKIPEAVKVDERDSGKQNSYYLWKHYNIEFPLPPTFKLVFTGNCNMTDFGNGFRGIGVSQGTFRAYLADSNAYPFITEIDGGGSTVTLAQNRAEPAGQYVDWSAMGAGLFPVLNVSGNFSVKNLWLAGTASLTVGDTITSPSNTIFHPGYQRTMIGAGLLAGALVSKENTATVTLEDVHANGIVGGTTPLAGGLIGYCGSPVTQIPTTPALNAFSKLTSITMKDCSVSNIAVCGRSSIGGFIGYTFADTVTVSNCNGTNVTLSADNYWNNSYNCGTYSSNDKSGRNGIGGMIGSASQTKLTVTKATMNGLSISVGKIANGNDNDVGLGGIVGTLRASGDSSLSGVIIDKSTDKTISISDSTSGKTSVGSLIGLLSGTTNGAKTVTISDVTIGETSEVALKGFQVGGLMGTVYQEAGSITLNIGTADNSVKIGHTSSDANPPVSISANKRTASSLSGLIAVTGNTPNVTIQNLVLSGISVGEAAYRSLILAQNPGTKISLALKNAEIISCKLTKKDVASDASDASTGFLLGGTPSDKAANATTTFNGFNILLNGCETGASGIFAGTISGTGSFMKLVAVSVVGGTGGTKDFCYGSGYVIRADYNGVKKNEASKNPYVDVNPSSPLGTIEGVSVSGDGAAFMEGEKTPIGTQIATEGKFYNVSTAMNFFKSTNASGIFLSSFSTAGDNNTTGSDGTTSGGDTTASNTPPDFPVLVLPAVSRPEVNAAVYNYISLLTNFASDAKTLDEKLSGTLTDSITAKTYRWSTEEGKFVDVGEPSITVEQDGTIHATPGKYDNTLKQFTLLTVSYKDPTGSGDPFNLYIPIVVQKLLKYHFYASAIPGTLYSRDTYLDAKSTAVTTHGDQITLLLSYVYDNDKTGNAAIEEWQNTVNNGDNLLWNFDKTIVLTASGYEELPTGTRLTLVDRNNQDKVYYATYDGSASISLSSFKDADNKSYVKNALCDAMGLKAAASDAGLFVVTKNEEDATVRIWESGKYVYYRPATNADTDQKFSITVTNEELREEYYLTIQTSKNDTAFSNITVECERGLTNSDNNGMMPNKFVPADSAHPFARNESENRILFGNFFKQTVTVTSTTAEEINDANNTIDATLTVTIEYQGDTWKEQFKSYKDAIRLYQRFELQAKQWTDGTDTSTSFTNRTATIRYFNGEALNDKTQVGTTETKALPDEGIMVLEFPSNANDGVEVSSTEGSMIAATLGVNVKLMYDNPQIQAQFNTRNNVTQRDGLQLLANSHLAYSSAALKRSNNPASGTAEQHFYRADSASATLVYSANGGSTDALVNQLGINGWADSRNSVDTVVIDSAATYDVRNIGAARNADTIRYSITLYCKDEDGKFTKEIKDYSNLLTVGNITARLLDRNGTMQTVKFGETFAGGVDISSSIQISVPLTVKTGKGFTGTYSNYKVELKVWLQNDTAQISGSEAQDYIIYTNAKIKFPLVTSN